MTSEFSVLMSIYQGENPLFFEQCLKSLVDQKLKASEVIIVEDGIIPKELKVIIDDFREALNIKSLILKENSGLAVALNFGLQHCKYNLVARMDSDDVSLADRFESQIKTFNESKNLDILGTYAQEIDSMSNKGRVRKMPLEHDEIYSCLYAIPFIHPSVMFKKSSILKLGGYNNLLRRRQDYDLWFRAGKAGLKFKNLSEILLLYRFDHNTHARQSLISLLQQGFIGLKGVCMLKQSFWKGIVAFIPFLRGLLPISIQHKTYNYLKKFDPREKVNH
jgi:glycosyltransferase involved in cell wall biosynthesis